MEIDHIYICLDISGNSAILSVSGLIKFDSPYVQGM